MFLHNWLIITKTQYFHLLKSTTDKVSVQDDDPTDTHDPTEFRYPSRI